MKRILQILILLAFFACCYQLVVIFFINEHESTYSVVATDDKKYTITETYQKVKDDHYYNFTVSSGKKKYSFAVNYDFGKQDQVIEDFKYYKSGVVECIYPIYKRGYTSEVSCQYNGGQVTYSYLQQVKNLDIVKIVQKMKKAGYDSVQWTVSKKMKQKNLITVYPDNLSKEYTFMIWNYKGIYLIHNNKISNKEFLEKDFYENKLSMTVGKYYVTVSTDNVEGQLNYSQLIVYNLKDGGKTTVDVEFSKNSYFNGVSDGLLYITDMDNKKQYVLNPAKKELVEQTDLKKVENHQLVDAKEDVFDSIQTDSLVVKNKQITKLYGNVEIKKYRNDYYFKTDDGKIYRVIHEDYKHPILVCQLPDIKDWKVQADAVSILTGNTIYLYTDKDGLRPIVVSNEFNYNYKNIYDFIREE